MRNWSAGRVEITYLEKGEADTNGEELGLG